MTTLTIHFDLPTEFYHENLMIRLLVMAMTHIHVEDNDFVHILELIKAKNQFQTIQQQDSKTGISCNVAGRLISRVYAKRFAPGDYVYDASINHVTDEPTKRGNARLAGFVPVRSAKRRCCLVS